MIVDAKAGLIVAANHLVADATVVKALLLDGRTLEATVLVRAGLGGALMNLHGRMIGVVVARRSGFAFAVPGRSSPQASYGRAARARGGYLLTRRTPLQTSGMDRCPQTLAKTLKTEFDGFRVCKRSSRLLVLAA
ncbi:hypothetical protein [Bradyrhizobium nitroreducens]|uniref:hypothetical protein n=1 Tax=Bradyrhizobium nitroreducens TaxID=709803 RepID=UPI00157FA7FF|nr:hypothetical protein [Bradyrhizobium nitroreducens]